VLQCETWAVSGGDSFLLERRGGGEGRSVTGDNKNIIIIISSKR